MERLFLVVLHHDGSEEVRDLADGTWEVGRAPGMWLGPLDPSLSRLHARLTVRGRSVVLEALPTRNGTKVNGVPLEGTRPLRPGDEVLAGRTLLRLGEGTAALEALRQQRTLELRAGRPAETVAASAAMKDVLEKARRLARTPLAVLVLGETGTGKEVVARLIHEASPRSGGPFVVVNCPAVPPGLVESELFGVEGGVATGVTAREGLLEKADGGTLFLDEVGDLPLEVQPKLLRFLQEKTVQRVGGRKASTLDVRVVSATHHDLKEAADAGRFRRDLFFRLSGATLLVPPLRERPDDVRPLAEAAVARVAPHVRLSEEGCAALRGHAWPGNVRELLAVVERAAHLADGGEIGVADLGLPAADPGAGAAAGIGAPDGVALLERIVSGSADFWDDAYEPYRRHELPKATLRELVEAGLSRGGGGVVELARLLRCEDRYRKLLDFLRNASLLPATERDGS